MISDLLMMTALVSYVVISTFLVLDAWFDFKMSGWIQRKLGWIR